MQLSVLLHHQHPLNPAIKLLAILSLGSLPATNRPIASKLNFTWSSMRMFTTQHDRPFRLILNRR